MSDKIAKGRPPEAAIHAAATLYADAYEQTVRSIGPRSPRLARQAALSGAAQSVIAEMIRDAGEVDLGCIVSGIGTAVGVTFYRAKPTRQDRERLLSQLTDAANDTLQRLEKARP